MIYEYKCPDGHLTTKLRKMGQRAYPLDCDHCGKPATPIISLTHVPPDGVYSYAPNAGDPKTFERRWENLKANKKLSDGSD